jgi:hypothetical protein
MLYSQGPQRPIVDITFSEKDNSLPAHMTMIDSVGERVQFSISHAKHESNGALIPDTVAISMQYLGEKKNVQQYLSLNVTPRSESSSHLILLDNTWYYNVKRKSLDT